MHLGHPRPEIKLRAFTWIHLHQLDDVNHRFERRSAPSSADNLKSAAQDVDLKREYSTRYTPEDGDIADQLMRAD